MQMIFQLITRHAQVNTTTTENQIQALTLKLPSTRWKTELVQLQELRMQLVRSSEIFATLFIFFELDYRPQFLPPSSPNCREWQFPCRACLRLRRGLRWLPLWSSLGCWRFGCCWRPIRICKAAIRSSRGSRTGYISETECLDDSVRKIWIRFESSGGSILTGLSKDEETTSNAIFVTENTLSGHSISSMKWTYKKGESALLRKWHTVDAISVVHEDVCSPVLVEHEDDVIFQSCSRQHVQCTQADVFTKRLVRQKPPWKNYFPRQLQFPFSKTPWIKHRPFLGG